MMHKEAIQRKSIQSFSHSEIASMKVCDFSSKGMNSLCWAKFLRVVRAAIVSPQRWLKAANVPFIPFVSKSEGHFSFVACGVVTITLVGSTTSWDITLSVE